MSWKPEVKTGNDQNWYDNSVRFATKEEAEASAKDLMARWMLVVDCRAVESEDPVNYRIDLETYQLVAVENDPDYDPDDKGGVYGGCAA